MIKIFNIIWNAIMGRKKKACTNCEFLTSYQMMNNRDERVDVHHCSMLSARVKTVRGNYIDDVAATVIEPETFNCALYKLSKQTKTKI